MSLLAIMGAISLGVQAIGGITNGIMNIFSADDQRNQQINELKFQNAQIEAERDEVTRQFENAQREGNIQISQGLTERDTAAAFNAQAGVFQNKQAYEEFNNLKLQATQLQGQQQASNALTGFRSTGTQERRVEQTDSQISRQLELARDKASLTIASTYLSSAQQYNESTRQVEAYKRQLEEQRKQYDYQMTQYETQIKQNQGTIDALAKERDSGWEGFLDFLEGWF